MNARAMPATGVTNAPKERFLYLNSTIRYASMSDQTKNMSDSYRLVSGTLLIMPMPLIS